MSASSSNEVLTLDKRAGDVMGKIQLGAYLTYSHFHIYTPSVRVMPATFMVGSDITASRVPSGVTKHKSRLTCGG
jgi:hypothetical protein